MEFDKRGTICYISHLDVMRMFKRLFKRAGIRLAYSQGFNPHPKMGFAQPLSLGYEATEEFIEFETIEEWNPNDILSRMSEIMADGITLKYCKPINHIRKSLSALTIASLYTARVPVTEAINAEELMENYLNQKSIITLKKQKNKKKKRREFKEVDIKPMIQKLNFTWNEGVVTMRMLLDQGSVSNLSPELVISTFLEFAGLNIPRSEISVTRDKIIFEDGVEI